jgi:hypothetical protein
MSEFNFLRDPTAQGAKGPFNFDFMKKTRGQANVFIYIALLAIAILISISLKNMPAQSYALFVVAAIVFLISFFNTDLALNILIFSMLLSPELSGGGASEGRQVGVRAEDIFLFVVFFGWLAKMAVRKEIGILRTNPLNAPINLYILICLVSSFLAIIQGRLTIKISFFYNLKYIEYFLLFFMVANNLKSEKQIKRFVFFLLLTGLIVCLYSWIKIPGGERLSAPFERKSGGGEPATFSGYLIVLMALTLGLALYSSSLKNRLLLLSLFGLAFVPFLYTLSRGGWVAFFPMFLMLIFLTKRFKALLIAVFFVGLIILPLVVPQSVRARIKDTFLPEKSYEFLGKKISLSESAGARLESWSVALREYNKHPLLGAGIPGVKVIDNQYTRVLIETGAFGTLVFLWLLIMVYRLGKNTLLVTINNNFAQGVSLGFLAGFFGLLFHALSAASFIIVRIMEPFWFLAAIVVMLPDVLSEEKEDNLNAGNG